MQRHLPIAVVLRGGDLFGQTDEGLALGARQLGPTLEESLELGRRRGRSVPGQRLRQQFIDLGLSDFETHGPTMARTGRRGYIGGVRWDLEDLDRLAGQVWDRLTVAARGRDPMHVATLATSGSGGPEARSVVLRAAHVESRCLTFHTNRHSAKVAQLADDPRVAWNFYDATEHIQLRVRAAATVHVDNDRARDRLQRVPLRNRRCYLLEQPTGSPTPFATSGVPAEYFHRPPTEAEAAPAFAEFAVVDTVAHELDWLSVHPAGHRRAHFVWTGEGWRGEWRIP